MSKWHGDWGRAQELVYGRDGGFVGTVVWDPWQQCWRASGERSEVGTYPTRGAAEQALRQLAGQRRQGTLNGPVAAPSGAQGGDVTLDQVAGALAAGAALVGGLVKLFGMGEEPQPAPVRPDPAAEELRQQNEMLRQQNEMLKEALGRLGPKDLARR